MQSNIGGSILDHFSSLTLDHQLIIYLSIQFFSDTENRNGMVWSYPQKNDTITCTCSIENCCKQVLWHPAVYKWKLSFY